jgi:hypothetical protein
MERIANSKARGYVSSHKPFMGSNLFAKWLYPTDTNPEVEDKGVYVVYSFGDHYPMFVYAEGTWFENEDKFSRTTSKHKTQCRPTERTILLSTAWMKQLVAVGYGGIAKQRILKGDQL